VTAASHDPQLFEGKPVKVERQVINALQLSGEITFPLRRLVTVWRNERWRAITTEWCRTTIGRTTFQISTWEWMISYRIDDVSLLCCERDTKSASKGFNWMNDAYQFFSV
jgi:hypothetical protein